MAKVWVYTDGKRDVELRVYKPDAHGQKSRDQGQFSIIGEASNDRPLSLEFQADVEGYYQLAATITDSDQPPTRAYLKVEYSAPPTSNKF
jgi:hypothetical protein